MRYFDVNGIASIGHRQVKISREIRLIIDQVRVLVSKDFKLKYNSTALGFIWSLMVPLLTSAIYFLVFGIMMRFEAPNYLLYLMSGTFFWQFFANVVTMSGNVMMANSMLLKKTSFNRELLVWGSFCSELIHFGMTIVVLFGLMWFYGVSLDVATIIPNGLVVVVSMVFFTMGISFAYAACNIFFRDLERIIQIVLMMWMFCSPVFIPISMVPQKYLWIYNLNPVAVMLCIWRDVFYCPGWHPQLYFQLLVMSSLMFVVGRRLFKIMEPRFAEMM